MRFVASWRGPDPEPGDVLRSERGRFAYVIERIVKRRASGRLVLEVERFRRDALPDLPPSSRVFRWVWDRR